MSVDYGLGTMTATTLCIMHVNKLDNMLVVCYITVFFR